MKVLKKDLPNSKKYICSYIYWNICQNRQINGHGYWQCRKYMKYWNFFSNVVLNIYKYIRDVTISKSHDTIISRYEVQYIYLLLSRAVLVLAVLTANQNCLDVIGQISAAQVIDTNTEHLPDQINGNAYRHLQHIKYFNTDKMAHSSFKHFNCIYLWILRLRCWT